MTLHYHGTPITPRRVLLNEMHGKCFCVSFFAPSDVAHCHDIGQAVLLDNGAFSAWKKGIVLDDSWWAKYYEWSERWLSHPTTHAIIPDVISGDAEDQDALIGQWPFGDRGWPVWHMHEDIQRLLRLLDAWPRVAIGSSGQYAKVGNGHWRRRIDEAFNAIAPRHRFMPWVHMLRGMQAVEWGYPFASVDSTDVARNHHLPGKTARGMAERWDARQCPAGWELAPVQAALW